MKDVLLIFILIHGAAASGFASFAYDARVEAAHGEIHAMRFSRATDLVNDLKKEDATVAFYYYLAQFQETIELLISQDKEAYKPYTMRSAARQSSLKQLDAQSPWKAYCLAEMSVYEAMIHAKFGEMNKAASGISNAYKLLSRNAEEHPEFLPTYKTLGLLEAGIGTLPDSYRKMVSILGYKGTLDGGYKKLQKTLAISDPNQKWIVREAAYLQMAVELYLINEPDKAWNTIAAHSNDYRDNLLAAFFRANTALKTGRNDEAIDVLQKRPAGSAYSSFHFMEFLLGSALLHRLDSGANVHLLKYIESQQKGDYIKSAYLKLTWYYVVFPDGELYDKYRKMTISHGNISLEEDKQALLEVLDGEKPNSDLLKVRCLFDGGYYDEAEVIIRPMRERNFSAIAHRIEYNYRKGRVFQKQGDTALARAFYLEAIDRGKGTDSKTYYVAYSAYYIGEMYEKRKDYTMAEMYYKMAGELGKSTNFKKSVEHKAKSGLSRIKKKN